MGLSNLVPGIITVIYYFLLIGDIFIVVSFVSLQVFLVRKITGEDAGTLYAMKVLKKATLKGKRHAVFIVQESLWICETRDT